MLESEAKEFAQYEHKFKKMGFTLEDWIMADDVTKTMKRDFADRQ